MADAKDTAQHVTEVVFDPDTITNAEVIMLEEHTGLSWIDVFTAWNELYQNGTMVSGKIKTATEWLMLRRLEPDITYEDVLARPAIAMWQEIEVADG